MKKIFYFLSSAIVFTGMQLAGCAQKGKPLFPNTPGVQTFTYRFSMAKDVAATLDTIRSLGITYIEGDTNPQGLTPEAFRKLLDDRHMTCPSVGVDYDDLVKEPAEIARKAKIVGRILHYDGMDTA